MYCLKYCKTVDLCLIAFYTLIKTIFSQLNTEYNEMCKQCDISV